MRSYLYLLAALCVVVGGAEAGLTRLNDYLIENVKNLDVSANLQAADKYLKELQSAKPSIFHIKNPINDVKLFVSLQQVVDDSKCDMEAVRIILDNQARGKNKCRRVDTVMKDVFDEHAQRCSKLYPIRFEKMRSQFGESAYKKVSIIGDRVMAADQDEAERWDSGLHQHFYDVVDIVERYVSSGFSIDDFNYGNYLRSAMRENAKTSEDVIYADKVADERIGKYVIHKDKMKDLIKEQLMQPCRDYVNTFGDALFVPAKVDARWKISEVDNSNSEFFYAWSYFNICRSLIENQSKITSSIINSASK